MRVCGRAHSVEIFHSFLGLPGDENFFPHGAQSGEHLQEAQPTVPHAARGPLFPHRPHSHPHLSHTGLHLHAMQPTVRHALPAPNWPHRPHRQPQNLQG